MITLMALKGTWMDIDHETMILILHVYEDGVKTDRNIEYVVNKFDNNFINQKLWTLINEDQNKEKKIKVDENYYMLQLAGKATLNPGTRIIGEGIERRIVYDADITKEMNNKIRERLDHYYSGFEQAMAERAPKRAENRKRIIEALLNADKLPEWPYIDLQVIEENA